MQQRVTDRRVDVADPGQRVGRVDDARAQGERLQPEALALVDEQRRACVRPPRRRNLVWARLFLLFPRRWVRRRPWTFRACRRRARGRSPRASGEWDSRAPTTPSSGARCASSIARSNVPTLLAFDRLDAAGVGAEHLEFAEPDRCEIDAGRRDRRRHDSPARLRGPQRGVEPAGGPGAFDRDVDAAEQEFRPALGRELHRVRRAPDRVRRLLRRRPPRTRRSSAASSRCFACLATTVTVPPGSASRARTSRARPRCPRRRPARCRSVACCARSAVWIAHESGSISTAISSARPSGTACSWERWATNERLHPPPVSLQ